VRAILRRPLTPRSASAATMCVAFPESRHFVSFPRGTSAHPRDMYEYWSRECALSKALSEGILQNIAGVPTITTAVEGWISWYPSDIVEPGSLDAARSDPYIGSDGEKPVFIAGPYDVTQTDDLTDDDREVETFLDAHPSQSVVLVSFGTLVDAGSGVNILLEELARSRTPFVFAAGGQLAGLPETTRLLLGQAKDERRAVTPNWLDLRRALNYPVGLRLVRVMLTHSPSCALSRTAAQTPLSRRCTLLCRYW